VAQLPDVSSGKRMKLKDCLLYGTEKEKNLTLSVIEKIMSHFNCLFKSGHFKLYLCRLYFFLFIYELRSSSRRSKRAWLFYFIL